VSVVATVRRNNSKHHRAAAEALQLAGEAVVFVVLYCRHLHGPASKNNTHFDRISGPFSAPLPTQPAQAVKKVGRATINAVEAAADDLNFKKLGALRCIEHQGAAKSFTAVHG
jgi:hypothetical protein